MSLVEGYGELSEDSVTRKNVWLRNFIVMAVCFSINHGCVTSVLALASSDFDDDLAAISSTLLYGTYTTSALFAAVPLVLSLGAKRSLSFGLWLYCFYLVPFAIILLFPQISKTVTTGLVVVGSTIGGFGAGWLWTAQGKYFATAAAEYAKFTGNPKEEINGYFGGIFSTIYVGCEVFMKLFSSVVRDSWSVGGKQFVFTFYAIAAIIAATGMLFVRRLPQTMSKETSSTSELCCKKLKDIKIVATDLKIWLLGPLNFAFGFTASYIAWYLNGKVGSVSVGDSNVGYLVAIIPGYAALAGIPYSYLGKIVGKGVMMFLGCLSYITIGIVGYAVPKQTLINGNWGTLIVLYIVAGNGRAVFESTNRAVFSDFFPKTSAGAFALLAVQSGLAGTVGFVVFIKSVNISPLMAAGVLVTIGGIACVSVPLAFYLNSKHKVKADQNVLLNQ